MLLEARNDVRAKHDSLRTQPTPKALPLAARPQAKRATGNKSTLGGRTRERRPQRSGADFPQADCKPVESVPLVERGASPLRMGICHVFENCGLFSDVRKGGNLSRGRND